MKTLKSKKSLIIAVLASLCVAFSFAESTQTMDVLFYHDVHSFLDRTCRAKTLVDEQFAKNPDTLFVDAGDFSQGSLYQTVYETEAAELRTLGYLGVDATTVGNHEFDRGAEGLANMFDAARKSGDKLPFFILSNVDWTKDDDYTKTVKRAFDELGGKEYVIIQKGDVKIALFGIFGTDALFCAPTCKLTFNDASEVCAKLVAKIKSEENPDMFVCLSHGGTDKNPKKSEDEILAKNVPELNLIISGHTHTKLDEPIKVGNTYIVSCSAYSEYLGSLSMERKSDGRWNLSRYDLFPITDEIPESTFVRQKLDAFNKDVDREYLSKFGLKSDTVLGKSTYNYSRNEMGYLMGDLYRTAVREYEAQGDHTEKTGYGAPIDVAVMPIGCIRDEFKAGPITAQDVFTAFSLGIGPDRITGYPLVSVYLTGKEIKSACEIDCSMGPMMDLLKIFYSGITYEYNPRRLLLDKVTKVYLNNDDGTQTLVEDNKLYRVVADLYSGKMLGNVLKTTFGLISIVPKNADGSPIENLDESIIMTDIFPSVKEFKAWSALASGIQIEKTIGDYSQAESKAKIAKPSCNPAKLFSHPSKFAKIVYALIFALIVIIADIVICCVISKKRKKD